MGFLSLVLFYYMCIFILFLAGDEKKSIRNKMFEC